MSATATIESLLFVATRPMPLAKLAAATGLSKEEVEAAVEELSAASATRGIRVMRQGSEVQLATAPESAPAVQAFLKDETSGELTKPALETLTIVAYRGPVAKAELEQIRGVNCSLILRNLLMRGLVEIASGEAEGQVRYRVTMDFLRFLGIASPEELPEFDKLRSHENITRVLEKGGAGSKEEAASPAAS